MRRIVLPAAILALGIAVAVPAAAAPGGVVVSPGQLFISGDDDYVVGAGVGTPAVIPAGTDLMYVNADPFLVVHTLTHTGGRFNSGDVAFGENRTLVTSTLAPNDYPFYCLRHPTTMRGTLRIV